MKKYSRFLFLIIIVSLLLGGCNGGEDEVAVVVDAGDPPTVPTVVVESTATDLPGEPVEVEETVPAAEEEEQSTSDQPELVEEAEPEPADSLLAAAWDDRSLFEAGLLDGEEAVLTELEGASVYHIAFELTEELTRLEGLEEVRYTNTEAVPLEQVLFRLFPNLAGGTSDVAEVRVNDVPVEAEFTLQDSVMTVPLSPPLQPGESTVISMEFTVQIPTEGGGNYGTFALQEDVLALAHFYPMIAVYDDEGWNAEIAPDSGDVVYADSSFYLVQVTAPADVVLATSGVPVETENLDGGLQRITYAAGPVRDFYVVGSERFEQVSAEVEGIQINSYTFPDYRELSEEVLAITVNAVELFNDRFGPYPFAEMDIATTPTLALGVEYPGIVVIASRLYAPDSPYPLDVLESTVAHEVAHQWFYSVVGNDQVDEPWVDESLTQYATLVYYEAMYGEPGAQGFRESLLSRWSRAEEPEMAVGMPVAAYEGVEYSAIIYGRGPLFFEELQAEMGEDEFAAFLQAYYRQHQWGIATTESLQAVAEEACECDLDGLFEEWIYP